MIELYNIDCMEYMSTCSDRQFDLAIVDPPYGIGNGTITAGNVRKNKRYHKAKWNNTKPGKEYFDELFRISENQIIWGGNYFDLPAHRCFIVWYKEPTFHRFSDFEYAWASFDMKPVMYHLQYTNIINRDPGAIHPTQKPIKLYKYLLSNYATRFMTILDTHLGSGSSAIAAYDYGCDFVGCEIDKDYFKAAKKRFDIHCMQQRLFV